VTAALAWQFVKGIASKIPLQAYAVLALLIAGWLYGNHRYYAGRESVLAELREAKADAGEKALDAIDKAGEAGIKRAERFEAEQDALEGAIERAEAESGNALDSLF